VSDPGPELPEEADAALAAEYVLRLLGPEEAAACAAREARDPDFAALVARWRADFEALDAAYAEVAPPAALGRRIEARLFGRPPSALARLWGSVGLWRAVAAAAVLAAIYLGALAPPGPGPAPEGEARLISALASSPGSDVSLLAALEPQAAVLNINRTSGEAPQGRSLELWAIPEGEAPLSLGVLPDTPRARIPLTRELAARIGPGTTLAISDEPAGGSPTGAPTGAVLAAGPVSEI
jgi:anti-sigma-K factor RskA